MTSYLCFLAYCSSTDFHHCRSSEPNQLSKYSNVRKYKETNKQISSKSCIDPCYNANTYKAVESCKMLQQAILNLAGRLYRCLETSPPSEAFPAMSARMERELYNFQRDTWKRTSTRMQTTRKRTTNNHEASSKTKGEINSLRSLPFFPWLVRLLLPSWVP